MRSGSKDLIITSPHSAVLLFVIGLLFSFPQQAFGATCSITDGSAHSSSYPCDCGSATCITNQYCVADMNACESYPSIIKTATETTSDDCPDHYVGILRRNPCQEIPQNTNINYYNYYTTWYRADDRPRPFGCYYVTGYVVFNYYKAHNTNPEAGVFCLRGTGSLISYGQNSTTCEKGNKTEFNVNHEVSTKMCLCGTEVCASYEVCVGNS